MHRPTRRAAALAAAAVGVCGAALAGGIAVAAPGDPDSSAALVKAVDASRPKNVILLVGDGMGDSEVTSARYYGKGADGRLNMDTLPFRGSIGTYVLSPGSGQGTYPGGPAYAPNYTPDSAPTATSWSTGKKTIDSRLSQGPSTAGNVPGSNVGFDTTMEIAQARGMRTGNVSTAEITDATPAAPTSHISQRSCQGPTDTATTCPSETKAAGGLGSIAEQQVDHQTDVVLGGGLARYQQKLVAGGSTSVLDYAQSKGYTFAPDASSLDGFTSLAGGKKVLGLFTAGNMSKEYAALTASDTGAGSPTYRCKEGNRPANEPSLSAMTTKAIDLLDEDNAKGFFLQVEGASIDKQDHASDACGQIGETLEFDNAIGKALEYQSAHPDTLVVVTADHSHTSQIIGPSTTPRGAYTTLQTKDGAPIRIAYGTAPVTGSQSHTGAEVPVMAVGPQAANVQSYNDQTDLFGTLTGRTPSELPGGTTTVTTPGQTTTVTVPGTTTPGETTPGTTTTVTVPVPGPSVPGPTTTVTVPGAPASGDTRPRIGLGAPSRVTVAGLRGGVAVSAGTVNATRVAFRLTRGGRTVASRTVAVRSGVASATLRVSGARRGTYVLRATATGPSGTKAATRSIRVR